MRADAGVEEKGVPDFWLRIFKNMDLLVQMIRVCPLGVQHIM